MTFTEKRKPKKIIMKENAKKIIQKGIDEIIPYDKNPRKNDKAVDKVANSIRAFGFQSPIIIDEQNVIICGHTRFKAAKKLGLKQVPCIVATGLTDAEIRAYRIADNKVGELAEWDKDLLASELELCEMNMSLFGIADKSNDGLDVEKYSQLGELIQYTPKTEVPAVDELIDETKQNELIENIKKSKADKKTKDFLTKAATRHCQFNFAKIAEFYAHQPKEIQELMEESGLVIIDFNNAIKNGFVELVESLKNLAAGIGDE